MVQQITRGIKVSVITRFEGTYHRGLQAFYAFSYTVSIENTSDQPVQLEDRHWIISDTLNAIEEVKGPGVVGETPVLNSGHKHTYQSGCELQSPFGSMKGYYGMRNLDTGEKFQVGIPLFKLTAPFAIN